MIEHLTFALSLLNFVLDFDSCKLEPCKHGICKDTLDGFECKCHAGFYGETCDWNTDDCIGNACENNSTCEDGILNYTCNCSSGFKGILCEIAMGNNLGPYFCNSFKLFMSCIVIVCVLIIF